MRTFPSTKEAITGGLATTFDLAAFLVSMIAPVKKSVSHLRTVTSMRILTGHNGKTATFFAAISAFDSIIFVIRCQHFLATAKGLLRMKGHQCVRLATSFRLKFSC